MPAKKIDVKGVISWAKVFEDNRDKADFHKNTDGQYKVTLGIPDDTVKFLRDAGCRLKIKTNDEGNQITFSRPHKAEQEWQGGAPVVANVDGTLWDFEKSGYIGNGSLGVAKIEIYDSKFGTGTRLLGLQVTNHVIYESPAVSSPSAMFQDLSKGSAVLPSSPPKEVTTKESAPF
jgi:hypothetical protein